MVGGLVDARKLIPNWQWAEKGGTLLYMAEAQRLRNWHQIAVGMVGGGEKIMVGLRIERLFESLFKKHLQISFSTLCSRR